MGRRAVPPPPPMADPTAYRWAQDLWRQLSSEQLIPSIREVASSDTMRTTDYTLIVTASSTATVNLMPASTVTYQGFYVKRAGTGVVVIKPHLIERVDGALTYTLDSQWSSVHIQSTGTRWMSLGGG